MPAAGVASDGTGGGSTMPHGGGHFGVGCTSAIAGSCGASIGQAQTSSATHGGSSQYGSVCPEAPSRPGAAPGADPPPPGTAGGGTTVTGIGAGSMHSGGRHRTGAPSGGRSHAYGPAGRASG